MQPAKTPSLPVSCISCFILLGYLAYLEYKRIITMNKHYNSPHIFHSLSLLVLDSERSYECIDFTMLCVFFLCLNVSNNASIFNFSSFSGSKVNLVGALGRSFFEIPNSFQKHWDKPKKKKKN
ncbi:Uncharacterized protein FWK35_00033765 [Aphis craccivora]|uniref:Uncharacterized protein n=1 Tax=Aphis craccivora TaxID=307492 RepID=A0A6G0XYS2_APHCR|nr:Uncharacterized protein FWK35_00033765 [Aphis craccivora]